MPRFFTQEVDQHQAILRGDDARHVTKVLRLRPGEHLLVCDGQGRDYDCVFESASASEVLLRVESSQPSQTEPSLFVTLYQALPKGDKLDWIIQKAVELGVGAVVPVLTQRCVSRPDPKSMEKKRERLQRIALEAAKQCGRGRIPQVKPLLSYEEALAATAADEKALLFYENSTTSFRRELEQGATSLSILVGAEGGLSPQEVEAAQQLGIPSVSLGKRILRCETAPLAALAVLMYESGNL